MESIKTVILLTLLTLLMVWIGGMIGETSGHVDRSVDRCWDQLL